MKRPLAYYGDPLLRKKSTPVEKIDEEILALAQDMLDSMYAYNGVGISAVQIKKPVRIFIICPDRYGSDGELLPGHPRYFINPVLSKPSEEMVSCDEGCLSIPGVRGEVIRPASILVEATNLEGERFVEHFEGYAARIIMHENDHLNGVLFIDRLSDKERRFAEKDLNALKKKTKSTRGGGETAL